MPKTVKGAGGGKRYPLNMRTTKETRERLEAAAAANGRSLAQEVETRLEQSFADQERFGGPEMLDIVNVMAGAFLRGGKLGARDSQHPEWTPAEWMSDLFCYHVAVRSVTDALIAAEPKLPWPEDMDPEKKEEAENLYKMFATWKARGLGNVQVHHGGKKK